MWFECYCGHSIHDTSDAHYFKAHAVTDKRWLPFWDAIDKAIETHWNSDFERESACMALRRPGCSTMMLYQCSKCARLYIMRNDGELIVFRPEDNDTPRNLFDH